MQRRQFMVLSGTVIAIGGAGCSGIFNDGPMYDPALNEEDLVPMEPQEAWPDNDLTANHDLNEHFPAVFINDDESLVVMFNAEIEEMYAVLFAWIFFPKIKPTICRLA